MYPDVTDAVHLNAGGDLVHRGFAGVNVDDLISSGQWVEVPYCLDELCDIQWMYQEREDYFLADAMGWVTRKMVVEHFLLDSKENENGTNIQNQCVLHLLSYCINAWNKYSIVKKVKNDAEIAPWMRRMPGDLPLTAEDHSAVAATLQIMIQQLSPVTLESCIDHCVIHIQDMLPGRIRANDLCAYLELHTINDIK
jgi:hypothetical protein